MRAAPVIDTSRYAAELRKTGVEPKQAEGMARVLNDELAARVLTKADLDERLLPIHRELTQLSTRLDAIEVKSDSQYEATTARFESLTTHFNSTNASLDMKFETKLDALDVKFETKLDALNEKFDTKFNSRPSSPRSTPSSRY